MDDFAFVDQGGTGQVIAFEPVVGAVADGRELVLFGNGNFFQKLEGLGQDAVWRRDLLFRFKQTLQCVAADQVGDGAQALAWMLVMPSQTSPWSKW